MNLPTVNATCHVSLTQGFEGCLFIPCSIASANPIKTISIVGVKRSSNDANDPGRRSASFPGTNWRQLPNGICIDFKIPNDFIFPPSLPTIPDPNSPTDPDTNDPTDPDAKKPATTEPDEKTETLSLEITITQNDDSTTLATYP